MTIKLLALSAILFACACGDDTASGTGADASVVDAVTAPDGPADARAPDAQIQQCQSGGFGSITGTVLGATIDSISTASYGLPDPALGIIGIQEAPGNCQPGGPLCSQLYVYMPCGAVALGQYTANNNTTELDCMPVPHVYGLFTNENGDVDITVSGTFRITQLDSCLVSEFTMSFQSGGTLSGWIVATNDSSQ